MGSEASIQAEDLSLAEIQKLFMELRDQENILSTYIPESPVSRLNRGESLVAPPELKEILELAKKLHTNTEGLFDIRVGHLVKNIYGFKEKTSPPASEKVSETATSIQRSRYDFVEGELLKLPAGVQIDFGGIGKGYAIWKATQKLKRPTPEISIRISGDLYCSHHCFIQIESPFEDDTVLYEFESCKKESFVSTSGNYRNFIGDPKTNHLLHPHTGLPQTQTASLTLVTTEPGFIADALATALSVANPQQRKKIAQKYQLSYLHIDTAGGIEKGPAFSDYFCKFKRK